MRQIARKRALDEVRAEHDALLRQRPRRPRSIVSSLLQHGAGVLGATFIMFGAAGVYHWMTKNYVSRVDAAMDAAMCLVGILLLRWSLKRFSA